MFCVSTSAFYTWRKQQNTIDAEQIELNALARKLFSDSRQSMGSRVLSRQLTSHGYKIGRFAARTLMVKLGLYAKTQRRHRYLKCEQPSKIAENKLNRAFAPDGPDQCWAGDITCIRIRGGWSYFAVVLDLFSRRIIGWAISEAADSKLVCSAIERAWKARMPSSEVLFHSDQGCQYTSIAFQDKLAELRIKASMSRKGNCWDNAPTERFFASLKQEWIPKEGYENLEHAQHDIVEYSVGYYNHIRLHSHNNYLTPVQREQQWTKSTT